MAENKVKPLKKSSDFQLAINSGQRIKVSTWLSLVFTNSRDGESYFGMVLSRKVGNAVLRNRLKRWVRNSVRTDLWPQKFKKKTVVFLFRAQGDGFYSRLTFSEFKKSLERI